MLNVNVLSFLVLYERCPFLEIAAVLKLEERLTTFLVKEHP